MDAIWLLGLIVARLLLFQVQILVLDWLPVHLGQQFAQLVLDYVHSFLLLVQIIAHLLHLLFDLIFKLRILIISRVHRRNCSCVSIALLIIHIKNFDHFDGWLINALNLWYQWLIVLINWLELLNLFDILILERCQSLF